MAVLAHPAPIASLESLTMARKRRRSSKRTAQQKKFGACARKTKGMSKTQRKAAMRSCLRK